MNQHRRSRARATAIAGVACLLLLFAFGQSLGAQSAVSLQAGSRVRLRTNADVLVGVVTNLSRDTIALAVRGQSITSVPWSSVSSLQLSVARRANTKVGALIGLGVGVAAAGFFTCCTGVDYNPRRDDAVTPGGVFAVGILVLGLPATGLGALIGGQVRTDVWRDVRLSSSLR